MKKIFISLITICMIFIITGCGKKDPLIGTWEGKNNDGRNTIFTFKKDNKINFDNGLVKLDGTYSTKGDTLTIKIEAWQKDRNYIFKIENNTLNLTPKDNDGMPTYKKLIKK